jgi:hypothetical protein
MPSRCDSTQQATWSKQLKRAEEDGKLRSSTMLAVALTARELVNVSRITMNEGMVGALSCDDTAAGIQANASHRVERKKWRVLRCAHALCKEWRMCGNGVSIRPRRPLAVEHLAAYSQTQAGVDCHRSNATNGRAHY